MDTYLVTGSAGHLGEALVHTLRAQGHRVVGLDVLDSPTTTEYLHRRVDLADVVDAHLAAARRDLDWEPRHDFRTAVQLVRTDGDPRSPLACAVGTKGYHPEPTGVYTRRGRSGSGPARGNDDAPAASAVDLP